MNILYEDVGCSLTKISHHLQVLRLSYFKCWLGLSYNQLTGTLLTEIGNLNDLNKDIQIIIQNEKSIKELRQYVHNNLPSLFKFPISVGSVPVSSLYDKPSQHLK